MTLKHIFKTASIGLTTNRSRSFLTILGIVIGITAIMLVISLGAGAQDLILGQIQGMGTKTIVVVPGREPKGPSDFASVFLDSLRENDLVGLRNKANVPYISDIMPVVIGTVKATYGSNEYQTTVLGGGSAETNNIIGNIFDIFPQYGTFFDSGDVLSRSDVVVIGDKVREKLFDGMENPVGQNIKLKGRNFKVIGVLGKKGQVSFFNFDDMVLTPYTTAQYYIFGKKWFDRFIISASSEDLIDETVSDIKATLRSNHNITDPDKDDFFVQTQVDLANRLSAITTALTWFLVAVASIALFVGGVGIMNIMLVSVTERTHEIGLRKALGATDWDILAQFLLEAVLLTAIGGAIGIIIGSSLAFIIALVLSKGLGVDWTFIFPWSGAALGLGVSALIGLVFGGYPAKKASNKSPIEALRYE